MQDEPHTYTHKGAGTEHTMYTHDPLDAAPWSGPMHQADTLACESCHVITLDNASIEVVLVPADGTLTTDPFEAFWLCVGCASLTLEDWS
jgi:hypothetical protein